MILCCDLVEAIFEVLVVLFYLLNFLNINGVLLFFILAFVKSRPMLWLFVNNVSLSIGIAIILLSVSLFKRVFIHYIVADFNFN